MHDFSSHFRQGGAIRAERQTAAMDLDFPASDEGQGRVPIHVPKRSKSTEFPMAAMDEKIGHVDEPTVVGGL